MTEYLGPIGIFVKILVESDNFTPSGVEVAFEKFTQSLQVHEHKPRRGATNESRYIKTTLRDAVEKARLPVYIPVMRNDHGNLESTVYRGLVFKTIEGKNVAIGIQDGEKIAPLSINQLRVCEANGWQYDASNVVGSAATMGGDLAVNLSSKNE